MKIQLGDLRRLIREVLRGAEAPEEAPLGQIAFSPHRLEKGIFKGEPNTPAEKALYQAFMDHLHANVPLSGEAAAMVKSLLDSGNYSKLFKEPSVATVYRGMTVSEDWLRGVLDLPLDEEISPSGKAAVSYVLSPSRGDAMSWSRSKQTSSRFSMTKSGAKSKPDFEVVLVASVAENPGIFLDMTGLYNVDEFNAFRKEREIASMGDVTISRIEWTSAQKAIEKRKKMPFSKFKKMFR
jgi:hypothetical protein